VNTEERESELDMLRYFWEQKGDLERYTSFEKAIAEFPEVGKAWADYKMAEKILSAVLRGVSA
jgi:hypothetical protein